MKDRLFALSQHIMPQHALSRLTRLVAESQAKSIKTPFINTFIKQYGIDMSEAANPDPASYANFNDFFTRALKPGARTIVEGDKTVACPADGAVSQLGDIESGRIFQAKGHDFGLKELLGGDAALEDEFQQGKFSTIYLSPKDYHRVHMPFTGTLRSMTYIPGKLFSVNPATVNNVDNLFARNERVSCIFDTEFGPMAVVLVGAMIVASIETVWAGLVTPPRGKLTTWTYPSEGEKAIHLNKGDELGRFKLGSTVILCFPKDSIEWEGSLQEGSATRMGQLVADYS
ncbi:archaetidylserine decarboxylase [Litoribrevibacter euphylliae]|uniref:Phosphatidylserine decarboxylase proenzyme n=1 Tax=Litoribrevibacter euphylliae TaxID=1834034 RepID=A0ABV7HHR2_9GAMM